MNYEYQVHIGLCAYLDILGSTELLRSIRPDDESIDRLVNRAELVRSSSNQAKKWFIEKGKESFCSTLSIISDSHFISFTDSSRSEESESNTLLLFKLSAESLAIHQLQLMHQNIFIRGGLAMGAIAHNDSSLVGKPVADAVDLEKHAIFPVITVSNDIEIVILHLLRCLQNEPGANSLSSFFVYRKLDNRMLINPFSVIEIFMSETNGQNLIKEYINNIVRNLSAFSHDEKILDKYSFLGALWNYTVETLSLDASLIIEFPIRYKNRIEFYAPQNF